MTAHSERITALQQRLRQRGLAAAFLHLSRDIFYFTGTSQPGWLFVSPSTFHFFLRSGLDFAQRHCTLPRDRISKKSRFADIAHDCLGEITRDMEIGAELDVMTVPDYRKIREVLKPAQIVDVSSDILKQRMSKDALEIAYIERAAQALESGHRAALELWRPGMTELEASAIVEDGQRRAGHEGVYFVRQTDFTMGRGPLASGQNRQEMSGVVFTVSGCGLTPAIPVGASHRTIQSGDLVIVDIPTCVGGYHGDQTRTYCVGQPSQRTLELHQALLWVSDELISDISPGMTSGEVFERARYHAECAGILDPFLKFSDGSMAHFVGHGVGLDLNEPPFLSRGGEDDITAGMVLAIELHVCDAESGMIKLEDMILVNDDHCRLLTLTERKLISVSAEQLF
ncbi:MAG: Xaa-Pro peptidase family protein [Silicimonas sp.]|jgi:Xaa-Pro dipeptidase|uniref:M24 family metallopeptidase n=1 Tax=Roseovarius TaxID=74030 RepID=UPI000A5BCBEE